MAQRVFGSDRLRIAEDGTRMLSCREPKADWAPRRPAEGIRKDFPGTCVRWEDENFEVIAVEGLPAGVRYLLRPWSDEHTIRSIVDYDAASEARRAEESRREVSRSRKAGGFSLTLPLVGLLPAEVQLDMESELGVSAAVATAISSIAPLLAGALGLIAFIASGFGGDPFGLPLWVYLVGVYFFVESLLRLSLSMSVSRPVGSLPVAIVWEAIAAMRGKRRTSRKRAVLEIDDATRQRDVYIQREPFLSLLSAPEQLALEQQYGFDWRQRGRASAYFLIVFAVFVIAVTLGLGGSEGLGGGEVLTLLIMGYLVWEQIVRLGRISAGRPAGSVLGVFVRAMSRKLFLPAG